jgi:hypothetical protein
LCIRIIRTPLKTSEQLHSGKPGPLQPLAQFKTGIKIDVELESERLVFLDNDAVVLKPVPIVNADSNFITRAIRPARSNSRHLFAVIE